MSGYSATYGYDAREERVAWVDSAEPVIHYTLRGLGNEILREVHELNGSWSWRKDYLYAGKEHFATVDGAGLKHVHKDHLGSARLVTSAAGNVVSQHNYWPFGEEMTVTSSPERMRFAGHERDLTSFLDYMHARFYAPWGGRFLSVDPGKDYDFHKPQSFNLYAYVRNNPVSVRDPDGRWVVPVLIGAGVGAGVHLFKELAVNRKPFSEAVKGLPGPALVGALGGVGRVGWIFAGALQGVLPYQRERSQGASPSEAKARGFEASGAVVLGSGLGALIGAATEASTAAGQAVGAGVSGATATELVNAAEALKQELVPIMVPSSGQLKDKLDQTKELEEELNKHLVKVNDRTNPSTGREER